jgi:type IV pilus assembly protein PilB
MERITPDRLLELGMISADQLRVALSEQRVSGSSLEKVITTLGFVSEGDLAAIHAAESGIAVVDLESAVADPDALALLPAELARRCRAVPLALDNEQRRLRVALADPEDLPGLDRLRAHLGSVGIEPLLASSAAISSAHERFYGYPQSIGDIVDELEGVNENRLAGDNPASTAHHHPLVRLVDAIITAAAAARSTDLHLHPEATCLRVRCRVDGILEELCVLHRQHLPAIVVRIKILAGLDIAEQRLPQDGRFTMVVRGDRLELRVSTLPTRHGESVVLRLLSHGRGIARLADLGLEQEEREQLEQIAGEPDGLVIVTGPTGSGKTTTLYSLLNTLDRNRLNIMTLEDPVEYLLPGVRQSTINESLDFGFGEGVRALLRQDPDVILIGEIRDSATATMALRAALTGHRVLATLHATSALGAIPRLIELGLAPALLADHLIALVGQRLVRRLCYHCREQYQPTADESAAAGTRSGQPLWRAIGCGECNGRGYRGRIALVELVRTEAELTAAIAAGGSVATLREVAFRHGFRSLSQIARRRLLTGDTSLAEMMRVVAQRANNDSSSRMGRGQ